MKKHLYRLIIGAASLTLTTIVVGVIGLAAISVTPYIIHSDIQSIGIVIALITGSYLLGWIYE